MGFLQQQSPQGGRSHQQQAMEKQGAEDGVQGLVVRLRKIVDSYLSLGQPDTAVHWADKLVSLGQGLNQQQHLLVAEDVHRLGRGLLATRQTHRAAHLVRSSGLHTKHLGCCHVATMALYQVRREIVHNKFIC